MSRNVFRKVEPTKLAKNVTKQFDDLKSKLTGWYLTGVVVLNGAGFGLPDTFLLGFGFRSIFWPYYVATYGIFKGPYRVLYGKGLDLSIIMGDDECDIDFK